jgi:hypothetical protein
MDALTTRAAGHVKDIVRTAIGFPEGGMALVIFDTRTPLSTVIADAYRTVLPKARFVDFDTAAPADVLAMFDSLAPKDLVVLVQSSNFRLNDFRLRIELFKLGLAVIEHTHLFRAADEQQMGAYVDSLAYDPEYYRPLGRHVKSVLDSAETIIVHCAGTELRYEGGMEPAKLNVGDYTGMTNIGGTFPIGEVFTEPKDFSKVNGEAMVFAYAGKDHRIRMPAPFKITVREGILVEDEGPDEFKEIMNAVREQEKLMVREFGVGLNKAFGKDRLFDDITAFERQHGLHFSLGEKHGIYKKPGLNPKHTRYHIDIFIDIEHIFVDGTPLAF